MKKIPLLVVSAAVLAVPDAGRALTTTVIVAPFDAADSPYPNSCDQDPLMVAESCHQRAFASNATGDFSLDIHADTGAAGHLPSGLLDPRHASEASVIERYQPSAATTRLGIRVQGSVGGSTAATPGSSGQIRLALSALRWPCDSSCFSTWEVAVPLERSAFDFTVEVPGPPSAGLRLAVTIAGIIQIREDVHAEQTVVTPGVTLPVPRVCREVGGGRPPLTICTPDGVYERSTKVRAATRTGEASAVAAGRLDSITIIEY